MCNCQSNSYQLPSLNLKEINKLIGIHGLQSDDANITIASMPDGKPFYFIHINNDFVVDIYGFHITGKYNLNINKFDLNATVSKDGNDLFTFSISIQISGSLNGKYAESVDVKKTGGVGVLSDFEDCVKRHAPNCVQLCCIWSCSGECIAACAVGAAACCLINTHC